MSAHADTKLRERCLKHEGNNHLRVDAFVIRLSHLTTDQLQAKCGMKMCNERRAAERILAWRAANQEKIQEAVKTATP